MDAGKVRRQLTDDAVGRAGDTADIACGSSLALENEDPFHHSPVLVRCMLHVSAVRFPLPC